MTVCADTKQEKELWSITIKRCKNITMSKTATAGDTFAPNVQAQAPGNNTGVGKTRKSVGSFVKKGNNRSAGSRFHGQRGHNNPAVAAGQHANLARPVSEDKPVEHHVGLRGISAGGRGHRRDRIPRRERVQGPVAEPCPKN